jgi:hypothetical protein
MQFQEEKMAKVTITIRGIDSGLLRQARASAIRQGMRTSNWLTEAIREKLIKDKVDLPFNLDTVAERTEHKGVFRVPLDTVKVGSDYTIDGRYLCAAGRKGDEEVVTYMSPATIHNLGYQIFWIR